MSRTSRPPGVFVALAAVAGVGTLLLLRADAQWDLATYRWAAKTFFAGGDPYDLAQLTRVAGENVELPFLYPPYTLPLLAPLAFMSAPVAAGVFLGCKALALVAFVRLAGTLLRDGWTPLFWLLLIFGFNASLFTDLQTGNVSLFEQLLLWLGLAAYREGRWGRFALLVVAASLCKLTLLAFLGLLLVSDGGARWRSFAGAVAAFVVLHLATFAASPSLYLEFLSAAWGAREHGVANPSSLALIEDLVTSRGALLLYAAWVAVVAILTVEAVRRLQRLRLDAPELRERVMFLACFAFALCAPRFKDYAFILLIIPTAWLFERVRDVDRRVPFALAAAFVTASLVPRIPGRPATGRLFWDYFSLVSAVVLFALARTVSSYGGRTSGRSSPG